MSRTMPEIAQVNKLKHRDIAVRDRSVNAGYINYFPKGGVPSCPVLLQNMSTNCACDFDSLHVVASALTISPRQDRPRHRELDCEQPTAILPTTYKEAPAILFSPSNGHLILHSYLLLTSPSRYLVSCEIQVCSIQNRPRLIPAGLASYFIVIILTKRMDGKPLRNPLYILYCPFAPFQGNPVNKAVESIYGSAKAKKTWYGPILVLGFQDTACTQPGGIDCIDLAAVSEHLINSEWSPVVIHTVGKVTR